VPTWNLLPLERRGLLHGNRARQPITASQLLRPESRFQLRVSLFSAKESYPLTITQNPLFARFCRRRHIDVLHTQHPERIRLNGSDCPEKGQAWFIYLICGRRSLQSLMLYRFVFLSESVLIHSLPSPKTALLQAREFVSPRHRDPLGMRVADLLRHHGGLVTIIMSSTVALEGL
jgi:hypothetical protein